MIVISACLTGISCRYDASHKLKLDLRGLVDQGKAIAVCPEELAGLSTPRDPVEKIGERYATFNGVDVTDSFKSGAHLAWEKISLYNINSAILKSKSPMCGVGKIYDGTFKGKTCPGDGEFTKLLKSRGINITVRN